MAVDESVQCHVGERCSREHFGRSSSAERGIESRGHLWRGIPCAASSGTWAHEQGRRPWPATEACSALSRRIANAAMKLALPGSGSNFGIAGRRRQSSMVSGSRSSASPRSDAAVGSGWTMSIQTISPAAIALFRAFGGISRTSSVPSPDWARIRTAGERPAERVSRAPVAHSPAVLPPFDAQFWPQVMRDSAELNSFRRATQSTLTPGRRAPGSPSYASCRPAREGRNPALIAASSAAKQISGIVRS